MKFRKANLKPHNPSLNGRNNLKPSKFRKVIGKTQKTSSQEQDREVYVELSDGSDYTDCRTVPITKSTATNIRTPPTMSKSRKQLTMGVKQTHSKDNILKHINPLIDLDDVKIDYKSYENAKQVKSEEKSQEDETESEPDFGTRTLPIRYSRATRYYNLLDIVKTNGSLQSVIGNDILYGNKMWEESESDIDWDPKVFYGVDTNKVLKNLQSETESDSEEELEQDEEIDESTPAMSIEISINGDKDLISKCPKSHNLRRPYEQQIQPSRQKKTLRA